MLFFLGLAGVISGITTVMFGFGGGFFTVPLLAYTLTLTASPGSEQAATAMNVAVATSALVMLASSLLATLRREGRQIAALRGLWPLALMIAIGAIPGALAARGWTVTLFAMALWPIWGSHYSIACCVRVLCSPHLRHCDRCHHYRQVGW